MRPNAGPLRRLVTHVQRSRHVAYLSAQRSKPSRDSPGNSASSDLLTELFPEYDGTSAPVPAWEALPQGLQDQIAAGVRISRSGTLKVSSERRSKRAYLTALVLGNASTSIDAADFCRIAGSNSIEGLAQVVPGLDKRTYRKLPLWILIFRNPYAAKCYQDQIIAQRSITAHYTPTSSRSHLPPSDDCFYRGRQVKPVLQDFTLLSPFQNTQRSITARLYPFSPQLNRVLDLHRPYHNVDGDRIGYPVRFSLSDPFQMNPDKAALKWVLRTHGRDVGIDWEDCLVVGPTGISLPAHSNSDGSKSGLLSLDKTPPFAILNFKTAAMAQRFIRWWHQRPLVTGDTRGDPGSSLLVHAEGLW